MAPKPSEDDPKGSEPKFDADPPHPDGFPGSDEESHLMSSRQGLKGLGYGTTPADTRRVMEKTGITREEARGMLHTIRAEFPRLSETLDRLNAELSDTGLHALKTWTEFFDAVADGSKTFEIRKNDRGFQVGDTLILRDWDRNKGQYTGRKLKVEVTYITDGGTLGCLAPGHVCMSIRKVDR